MSRTAAIAASSCSSLSAFRAAAECSNFISLGTNNAQIFMYAAG
jgi:hypothetical protein